MRSIPSSLIIVFSFLIYPFPAVVAAENESLLIAQNDEAAETESLPSPSVSSSDAPANLTTEPDSEEELQDASAKADEENESSEESEEEDGAEEEDVFGDLEEEFQAAEGEPVFDPLEGYNRVMTDFNDGFYVYVFDPVRDGYRYAVPEGGRLAVANFFDNLLFPLRFINNALQAKFMNTGEETLRFVINSTIGLLGFFDPAEAWFGLDAHPEDFGQTLGYWGVGAGPHVVLPFLGPSNLRDTFSLFPDDQFDVLATSGLLVDSLTKDPLSLPASVGLKAFRKLNDYSVAKFGYQDIKKDAMDLYPYLRDAYEALRNKQISE